MYSINLIEIDFEGQVRPLKQLSFDFLPRINEHIILSGHNNEPSAYKVIDVHFVPGDGTILYITYEKPLQNVIESLLNETL